jgi:methionyl-tRNA formyltransferase
VFRRPARGSYVIHDSLLPAYRGFSPTVWALVNGEQETGATLFAMEEGVDSGDVLGQEAVGIGPDDTIADVMARLTPAYERLVRDCIPAVLAGTAARRPQDESRATYTCRRVPADNVIRWDASTERIHNLIRAVTRPYPGALTRLEGRELRIWRAAPLRDRRYVGLVPGRVAEIRPGDGVVVLTGDGGLLVREIQFEGEAPQPAAEAVRSLSLTLG